MKRWLADLEPRERWALAGAGCVLLAIGVAAFVWVPLEERREALAARIDSQASTLSWMQQARQRVEAARDRDAGSASRDGRSLLALVDDTARESGLSGHLRRAEPAGPGGVRVWLETARYADVAGWMESLAGRYGLAITELSLDRAGDGRVNARVTVAESGGP